MRLTRRGVLKFLGLGALSGGAAAASAVPAAFGKGGFYPRFSAADIPYQTDTPERMLQKLVLGNARFLANDSISHLLGDELHGDPNFGQRPPVMVLSCADSRVTPELAFDMPRATLFVCRVAGNIATDEIAASLEYGTKVLGARLLVVLGHSHCGAVSAAISFVEGATFPPEEWGLIGPLVELIAPAAEAVRGAPGSWLENATDENARLTAAHLRELDPIIAPLVRDGSLLVTPARYNIGTGQVVFV
jgi:carbonic anhydrase